MLEKNRCSKCVYWDGENMKQRDDNDGYIWSEAPCIAEENFVEDIWWPLKRDNESNQWGKKRRIE